MGIHAFAALESGGSLKPFEYAPQELGVYDVEIKISHCGICHSDVHLINNDWGGSSYPLVAGHEIVGTVTSIGTEVGRITLGQRVGVGWQSGSCLACEWCLNGYENLCKEKQLTCIGKHGGFADFIRTDGRFVFPIPESLDSAHAAPLLCAGVAVYSPIKICGVQPHHRVGVAGIGGLGHIAVQFARAIGCEVTALSTTPDKENDARRFGADHFINSNDEGQMRTAAGSLDFILFTATATPNWMSYLNLLRPNGRLNIVGRPTFAGGSAGTLDIPAAMLVAGQKAVSGSVIGGRAIMREMLSFAARHGIKAQIEELPMAGINSALEKVRHNQARYRIVLKN
jgi:uncharacterized zinc-type alcohol dehydrogenase-like protein